MIRWCVRQRDEAATDSFYLHRMCTLRRALIRHRRALDIAADQIAPNRTRSFQDAEVRGNFLDFNVGGPEPGVEMDCYAHG